ncbi:Signal recognition particle subunit Ffh SRP54 [Paramagnetospirillum magnetotacticum MS-1]|uniref:Signal recognition particle protein n=1 Tax=Paramagnetospirillum magnetotacticum MS-1 TaxID=272627 RepID=A0A0C2UX61_PARME|nr:signal recognition particle protein [Paramagnetospirillum magnetotacticum]KIL97421.1 Signal recognition particle subunit Ffh SRP54 [Paramagnetospirillum magnetotacticum MS-1]
MFESLSSRLGKVFEKLTGRGALSEADVTDALREVRVALLEADVALSVVKEFIGRVKARAVGAEVIKSVSPGQMVVKIVHDELIATLGTKGTELNLNAVPPVVILMVGLQGSGKTTTSAKIALKLKKEKKKVLLASLDVYRPAAQQQLQILAGQAEVGSLPIVMGEMPVAISKRALDVGRKEGYDVVILDTAGRLHIDQELMAEVAAVRDAAKPTETLLVTDAMVGQDAVTLAREFNEKVGVTGIVLTRIDGDARGGAALSMRAITGRPIKFLGAGEKLDALEVFHPDRIAGRILGMGDVVGLVEKAMETLDQEEAERLAKRMEKGKFDLDDMRKQFAQVRKMGDLKGILGMLPGIGKMAGALKDANIDNKMVARQEAIITSMTKAERKNPDLIKASRKKRIAAGAGVEVQDVNKLLKQYQQMADMMKKVGKLGQKGLMRHGIGGLLPPGMKFGR